MYEQRASGSMPGQSSSAPKLVKAGYLEEVVKRLIGLQQQIQGTLGLADETGDRLFGSNPEACSSPEEACGSGMVGAIDMHLSRLQVLAARLHGSVNRLSGI